MGAERLKIESEEVASKNKSATEKKREIKAVMDMSHPVCDSFINIFWNTHTLPHTFLFCVIDSLLMLAELSCQGGC